MLTKQLTGVAISPLKLGHTENTKCYTKVVIVTFSILIFCSITTVLWSEYVVLDIMYACVNIGFIIQI